MMKVTTVVVLFSLFAVVHSKFIGRKDAKKKKVDIPKYVAEHIKHSGEHNEVEVDEKLHMKSDIKVMPNHNGKRATIKSNRWLPTDSSKTLQIPYIIDGSIPEESKMVIEETIKIMNNHLSCVDEPWIKKRSSDTHYIKFIREVGCWSYVGKQRNVEAQEISIGEGCDYTGTIAHEMMHAMGFYHEQSRPDRDQFVTINLANVQPGAEDNFEIQQSDSVSDISKSPYDYSSLMHYGRNAFSVNGEDTITPKQNVKIGQRNDLSIEDIKELNAYFGCDGENIILPKPTLPPPPVTLRKSTFSADNEGEVMMSGFEIVGESDVSCKDSAGIPSYFCPTLKSWNLCNHNVIKSHMLQLCAETCSLCPAAPTNENKFARPHKLYTGHIIYTNIQGADIRNAAKCTCYVSQCDTISFCLRFSYKRVLGQSGTATSVAIRASNGNAGTDTQPIYTIPGHDTQKQWEKAAVDFKLNCQSVQVRIDASTGGDDEFFIDDLSILSGKCQA